MSNLTLDDLARLQAAHNRHLAFLATVVTTYREKEGDIRHNYCIRHAAGVLRWLERVRTTGQPCELCAQELAARGVR